MRLNRVSWLVAAALTVLAGACKHDDPVELISQDGVDTIPAIDLTTAAAAGALTGTRAVNRFISSGPFDTSVVDAFARLSSQPAMRGLDANGFGYTSGTRPQIVFCPAFVRNSTTDRYLPRLVSDSAIITTFYGSAQAICYLVQAAHPFNGGLFWEFWFNARRLDAGKRHVMGVARYALQQRGALDIAEVLLSGAVTQPDSLVFRAGDFAPAGYKDFTQYGAPCPDPTGGYNAVAGANPHLLGSDVDTYGPGLFELDVTICRGSVWANDFGSSTSPVPPNNNTALGSRQYNFLVLWEALADSTPNYARPVLRVQIGPLLTTAGTVVNNSYGPLPAAALTSLQLAPLPGATSRPDTLRLTFNNLKPLASGAYQVWLLRSQTDTNQLVTGRVVRLRGTTVVDTLNNVSAFNITSAMNAARIEMDVGTYSATGILWNAAALTVAPTTTNTTLPTSQSLWTTAVAKPSGTLATFLGTLTFGSFRRGATPLVYGAVGAAAGGIFGRELREDVQRLQRPPIGYYYEAWLTSSTDTSKYVNLGPLLAPYPALTSLIGADTLTTDPLSGVEITRAAMRYVASSTSFYCTYDRVQVRLAPKNGVSNLLSPTLVLSGTNPRRGC